MSRGWLTPSRTLCLGATRRGPTGVRRRLWRSGRDAALRRHDACRGRAGRDDARRQCASRGDDPRGAASGCARPAAPRRSSSRPAAGQQAPAPVVPVGPPAAPTPNIYVVQNDSKYCTSFFGCLYPHKIRTCRRSRRERGRAEVPIGADTADNEPYFVPKSVRAGARAGPARARAVTNNYVRLRGI